MKIVLINKIYLCVQIFNQTIISSIIIKSKVNKQSKIRTLKLEGEEFINSFTLWVILEISHIRKINTKAILKHTQRFFIHKRIQVILKLKPQIKNFNLIIFCDLLFNFLYFLNLHQYIIQKTTFLVIIGCKNLGLYSLNLIICCIIV